MIQFVYPSTLLLKLICINDISSLSKFMEICKQGETVECMMQFLSRELNKYWRLNDIYCNVLWSSLCTTLVPDTSDKSATQVRHEWEILIFITARIKTYFQTPILAIWQMKHYEERNNFILRTTFEKCLIPMPKCIWKVHHKNWIL